MEYDLSIGEHSMQRTKQAQIDCGNLMRKVRGVVDDETFDILGQMYAVAGNAALNMQWMIDEIKELKTQVVSK